MKIKLDQRMNPQEPDVPGKWFATPVPGEKFSTEMLRIEISQRTTVSEADAEAVFMIAGEILSERLRRGCSVYIHPVGSFRLGLQSEGVKDPKDFKHSNILGYHIIFTPDARLLRRLEGIRYEDSGLRGAQSLNVNWLVDLVSGTANERLTPGGSVCLTGQKMKIGGADPSVGLSLINVDSQVVVPVPMTSIPVNRPKEIIFVVPVDLPAGRWQVRIVTQLSSGRIIKSPRGFTYPAELKSLEGGD